MIILEEVREITDILIVKKELLDQLKDRRDDAKHKVDDVKNRRTTLKMDIALANEQLDRTTKAYAAAIQNMNQLSEPSEEILLKSNLALEMEKDNHEHATTTLTNLKALDKTSFQELIQYEKIYDDASHNLEQVKNEYDQLLNQSKTTLSDSNATKNEVAVENVDFLLNFLNQAQLITPTIDSSSGMTYDADIPFENRPARKLPSKHLKPTGHITWDFLNDRRVDEGEKDD